MRQLLALCLALTAGCGESSDSPDQAKDEPFVRRQLSAELVARPAIAYSGYRTGQSPDTQTYPSEAQILEDLKLVEQAGFSFLRLFDAGVHAERVLTVIAREKLDMKVMLGVWIAGSKAEHDKENRVQFDNAVRLYEAHKGVVAAISVGNETLDSWSNVLTPVADLAGYIKEMRAKVDVPVTTDDSWLPFSLGSDGDFSYANVIEVARVCDFLSLHVYAFADAYWDSWDYKQTSVAEDARAEAMMNAAMAYTRESVRTVKSVMAEQDLDMPLLIGEAGWKDKTAFSPANKADAPEDAIEFYFAHSVNQRRFYDDLSSWTYGATKDADSPLAAFYFEAFDEPWKGEWGDDGWGLFDVERKAKWALWSRLTALKPEGATEPKPEDAAHYVATTPATP
jgi:exo-beta-1,3-glucanase (GH17 family)